jgi:hypothetical protein
MDPTRALPQTRRIPVAPEPLLDALTSDYADSFQIELPEPDHRSPERWVRAGLEGAPAWVRAIILFAHTYLLRFRLEPTPAPDRVLGWRITISSDDAVVLRASGPLLAAAIVGRRSGPTIMTVTTFVGFRHRTAPAIWAVVGPAHRRIAPRLLVAAARTDTRRRARR